MYVLWGNRLTAERVFDFPLYLQDIIRAAAENGHRTGCEGHDYSANS